MSKTLTSQKAMAENPIEILEKVLPNKVTKMESIKYKIVINFMGNLRN